MVKTFEITGPLPPRGSAAALREQLRDHLLRTRPSVGEKFFSDHELARIAQLSRPTVRRALDELERDGWIERRPGIGTFIGPRAAISIHLPHDGRTNGHANSTHRERRTVRLALLMHMIGDFAHDWYVAGLIRGIDGAAEEHGVSLELLGNRDGDVAAVSRRMLQTRPDVLAFAAPALKLTPLLCEARRLEIQCIGTGTLVGNLGFPAVMEDGEDGMRRGVKYLAERGHRRIGLIVPPFALPWTFQRRLGYMEGMTDAGLDADEGMVLWLDHHDEPEGTRLVKEYLERRQPTAIVLASWTVAAAIAPLVQSGELSIPDDLSVVCFDQHPGVRESLGVPSVTTIDIPLEEMGRRLAYMSRKLAMNETIEQIVKLPCPLVEGASVAPPAAVHRI